MAYKSDKYVALQYKTNTKDKVTALQALQRTKCT